ncbi:gluconokinase [Pseudoclavibacter sp. JAI123]|uniref:gluconokinase n=1 Tax=Pseudoclavibacter sp. JAI123 TaxID=2723065 RepID=UPI0017D53533|nr:gluconokinase [Pseudoclavibacter sp. JAI123]NYF12191.1 gluconokinase [Pseudoclavibacter sp. JAI123]
MSSDQAERRARATAAGHPALTHPPMIVMGVQGTGKTTIGSALAERLGVTFIDSDDLHPVANKTKMAAGTPLEDEDRVPWLKVVGASIAANAAEGRTTIVACSALKRWYRELLRSSVPELQFVHLAGQRDLVASRLATRQHEYMPTTLLDSQFEVLEPLAAWEAGVVVDVAETPAEIVEAVVDYLAGTEPDASVAAGG